MRVLAVTNMYPTPDDPAYGAFVAAQIHSLREAGARVEVEFINGRESGLEYLRALRRVGRLARRERFDVVHAHHGLSGCVAAFQRLPLVVTFYGDDLLGTPAAGGRLTAKSRLIRLLAHVAARRGDELICMSDEMRAALPRAADRARAHVIPNGVNVDRFSPGDRAAARHRLGLALQDKLVLFPNTPGEARKRLDVAEAALARLAGDVTAVRLWVVTGISHDQMPDHYRAADCLLLTSEWEGSPNVVKEALCCDLPVVSVEVGDARRWMDLATGCRLVERRPEAVAAGLCDVLRGPGRVDGGLVRAAISTQRVAAQVIAVYRDAIARRRDLTPSPSAGPAASR